MLRLINTHVMLRMDDGGGGGGGGGSAEVADGGSDGEWRMVVGE